jgi:hypothetical protein
MSNLFTETREGFIQAMKGGNGYRIPENPFKDLVFEKTPEQTRLTDLTNFVKFDLKIIRALPDQQVVSGVMTDSRGQPKSVIYIYMTRGKASKIQETIDWYESIKNRCIKDLT